MEDLSWEIEQGINPCILGDFTSVSGGVLEDSIQWQHKFLRDNVDPQGGDFQGSSILVNLSGFFWVS